MHVNRRNRLRLLTARSISTSSERNWALWGRVYTSARTALGLERAKKLITFCFNDRCRVNEQNDFHMLLETVENLLTDESSEATEEAVADLHEAAVDVGAAAAVAATASSAGVGQKAGGSLGTVVAPPAPTSG